MASSKEYLDFILEQLSDLDEITYRPMMGEYILYYRDKLIGGIYDDRFLVKPVKSAVSMMPDARKELPYDGAKELLLVENVDDRDFLQQLLCAMYPDLPAPKKRK
jgi:TfoX/Sxy family transcriptional regulator of competence genes